ncbi:MAG: SHOCT domain-containing protein [Actinomycetota bacterium]
MMYGYGGWWMWLWMLLFWGGLIAVIVWAVQATQHRGSSEGSKEAGRAMHILEERFARGEIDEEEFERRRRALESR